MGFETFSPAQPEKEENKEQKSKRRGLGFKLKRAAGILGVSGLGLASGMHEGTAAQIDTNTSISANNIEHVQSSERGKVISNDKNFEIRAIGEKKTTNYGTPDKPRMVEQSLYSVLNKATKERKYFFADNDAGAIKDGYQWFLTENDKRIIETERAFQQSGLTDPHDAYDGPIKVGEARQVDTKETGNDMVQGNELTKGEKDTLEKVRATERGLKDRGYVQE